MTLHRMLLWLSLLGGLSGCAGQPVSTVSTPDTRPALAIRGAPADAMLQVDGLTIGAAAQFHGQPTVLKVEPGRHTITIVRRGQTLLTERLFLGEGEVKILHVGKE